MGQYARHLHQRLASTACKRSTKAREIHFGEPLPKGIKTVSALIAAGHDPVHAAYVQMQNLTAEFAERVADFPEMHEWTRTAVEVKEEYLPSGPPMSPLSTSYFTMWSLYDLRMAESMDTLSRCLIECGDALRMSPQQLDIARKIDQSRMGIYEHVGRKGRFIELKELITGHSYKCLCTSGYSGIPGELWYVRLLPPLEPELGNYWITMTTPYILIFTQKADWIAYLKRTMVQVDRPNDFTRLHHLLKYGLETNHWHEFVFLGYVNYQTEAVYLTGIPDRKNTLPHAN